MKFRHFVLHTIYGVNPDKENDPIEIYSSASGNGRIQAYLTGRPDQYCELLDRRSAIMFGLVSGMFGSVADKTFEDRVAAGVEAIKQERRQKYPSAMFLVVESSGEEASFCPQSKREIGSGCNSFTISLDDPPTETIRDIYRRPVRSLIAALGVLVDVHKVSRVSEGTVFFENDGRPCFASTVSVGNVDVYVSKKVASGDIERLRNLSAKTVGHDELQPVYRLFSDSFDREQDELRQFLAAWMALEVFVNKNFHIYEDELIRDFDSKLTIPMKNRYIKTTQNVMRNEYSFLDRFVVVSGRLCPEDAEADYDKVCPAHKLRNDFSHGTPIIEQNLPTKSIQQLAGKLLMKHLDHQKN